MFRKRIRDLGARPRRLLTGGCAAERLEGRLLFDVTPTGPQFLTNNQREGGQTFPAVAADEAGNFVVVWEGQGEVSARRFTAAGSPLGPQFRVADGKLPAVAMDADGDFVVTWQNPYLSVEAARYSAAGVKTSLGRVPTTENHGPDTEPQVAMSRSGQFVISWTSDWTPPEEFGRRTRVYARRFGASGQPSGPDFRVSDEEGTTESPERSSVAMDADGDFVVAWTHLTYGPSEVLARRYDASGEPLAGSFPVARGRFFGAPAVAMDADGDFVVTYSRYGGDLYWRRYDRTLDLWGADVAVTPGHSTGGYRPAIDMDADGDFCIAWGTGFDYDPVLSAQWFSAGGAKIGERLKVNTEFPPNIAAAVVAVDEQGGFAVAWQEYGSNTNGWDIMARRFIGARTATPDVTGVFAGGTRWDANFAASLEQRGLGHEAFGLVLPLSAPSSPLPWVNVDRITLSFRRDVAVRKEDLAVRGAAVGSYPVTDFHYDAASRTGTWTLGRSIPADRVSVELGGAAGGAGGFRCAFNVLPGDVNRDGRVNVADLLRTRRPVVPAAPGAPADAVFADVDGSNSVNAVDALWVRLNQARALPPPGPAAGVAGGTVRRGAPVTRSLLTSG